MQYVDTTTAITGLAEFGYENNSYPIRANVPSSLSEALAVIGKCDEGEVTVEAPEGAISSVLSIVCAAWEQNAKQGGKEKIRKVMGEGSQEKVDAEVKAHQTRAESYVPGAARGGVAGGVTKTKAGNVGKGLLAKLGPEALMALAAEHGLTEEDFS